MTVANNINVLPLCKLCSFGWCQGMRHHKILYSSFSSYIVLSLLTQCMIPFTRKQALPAHQSPRQSVATLNLSILTSGQNNPAMSWSWKNYTFQTLAELDKSSSNTWNRSLFKTPLVRKERCTGVIGYFRGCFHWLSGPTGVLIIVTILSIGRTKSSTCQTS